MTPPVFPRASALGYAALLWAAALLPAATADASWFSWLNPELRNLGEQRLALSDELAQLGIPSVGQTALEHGYQFVATGRPLRMPVSVSIDLGAAIAIDYVALVPAISNWQPYDRSAYGFPRRFRIEASNEASFHSAELLADFTGEDFPDPGLMPVVVRTPGLTARYLRVSVTKLAEENGRLFYALSELMVLSGNLNCALNRPVTAPSGPQSIAWRPTNLTDGRTPLGPPVRPEFVEKDGFYIHPSPGTLPVITLDLHRLHRIQQVRLHPVHSRRTLPAAGEYFPRNFKVEVSTTADFAHPEVLYHPRSLSNPGNNVLTVIGRNVSGRYVRIAATAPVERMAFSEIEVYADGHNIARDATIAATPDRPRPVERWPETLLNDGYASHGRIIELPEWLREWERRGALKAALARLEQNEITATALARQRATWLAAGGAVFAIVSVSGLLLLSRRKRRRELQELRARLARDLHDEIGSNLAGLAVLSDFAQTTDLPETHHREAWSEVRRTVDESIAAIREVLWLTDPRQAEGDFLAHFRSVASRMLAGKEVVWVELSGELPDSFTPEAKRHLSLFFKEALANVVRHSHATRVELGFRVANESLRLEILDNGIGFDPAHARRGIGLTSLRQRAAALHGRATIQSTSGRGTRVILEAPLGRPHRVSSLNPASSAHVPRLADRG